MDYHYQTRIFFLSENVDDVLRDACLNEHLFGNLNEVRQIIKV